MSDASDRLKEAAEIGARERALTAALREQTKQLYEMPCFATLPHPDGWPMVMRVPGGWVFYIASGGGSLVTSTVEADEDGNAIIGDAQQTIVNQPVVMPVFVPFDNEFMELDS